MVHYTTTDEKYSQIADHAVPAGLFLAEYNATVNVMPTEARKPSLTGGDGGTVEIVSSNDSADKLRLSTSNSSGDVVQNGVGGVNKNQAAGDAPENVHAHQWKERLCPSNTETLIVVDNMLASVAKGVVPPVLPADYRAKILGLSTMPASLARVNFLRLDASVAAVVVKRNPTMFDAVEHILAWDDLDRNKHAALIRNRVL
jgi:hypothetical protein